MNNKFKTRKLLIGASLELRDTVEWYESSNNLDSSYYFSTGNYVPIISKIRYYHKSGYFREMVGVKKYRIGLIHPDFSIETVKENLNAAQSLRMYHKLTKAALPINPNQ
jgi:hypothetical protein